MLEHYDSARPRTAAAAPPDAPGEDDGDEKIGIARITLRQPRRGVSAVVAGFFEADRLLLAWKGEARKAVDCEFTVRFTDGASLRGTLPLSSQARGRPALWAHIRQSLRPDDKERRAGPRHALLDQDGQVADEAMLDHYAVDKQPYDLSPARRRAA